MKRVFAVGLVVIGLVGCGSSSSDGGSSSADGKGLKPAGDVIATRATKGKIGTPFEVQKDVTMTLSNPRTDSGELPAGSQEPYGVALQPTIRVDVRVDNASGADEQGGSPEVVCAGATRGEGFQAGSSYDPNADVPAGSFVEGTLILLPTGNDGVADQVPGCAGPAVFRIGTVDVPVPDDVLASYNNATDKASTTTNAPSVGSNTVLPAETAAPTVQQRTADITTVWCEVALGDSQADVIAAMGPPQGSLAADYMRQSGLDLAGITSVEWDIGNSIYVASFESDKATNLQAYDQAVGPIGARGLSCDPFRHP